jgi:hypothetical protein
MISSCYTVALDHLEDSCHNTDPFSLSSLGSLLLALHQADVVVLLLFSWLLSSAAKAADKLSLLTSDQRGFVGVRRGMRGLMSRK